MQIQIELLPLHRHLFVEPNPIPVKWAMARMGLCGGALRLPLTEFAEGAGPWSKPPCASGLLKD